MNDSCNGTKNSLRRIPDNENDGYFLTVTDGAEIFVWERLPKGECRNTIYIISGITGINHANEREIVDILSNDVNRVVVIHPRGTGYSEGSRGDTDPGAIIEDYCEIIKRDSSYSTSTKHIFLFGHSMSCAFALEISGKLQGVHGLILVNPPFKLKPAKGMSPGLTDYLRYFGYYVFAPHIPVVNMAGDPTLIANEPDRIEAELRNSDRLLVKYFSMRCMVKSKKIMDSMSKNASQTDLPLLLLYGENDNIVDKSGSDAIFSAWKSNNKRYVIINGGSHGKSTVIKGTEIISGWIENL